MRRCWEVPRPLKTLLQPVASTGSSFSHSRYPAADLWMGDDKEGSWSGKMALVLQPSVPVVCNQCDLVYL